MALELIRNNAKTTQKTLCIAWLDFQNAFGSVVHSTLTQILGKLGMPDKFNNFVREVYDGASWILKIEPRNPPS